MPMLARMTEVRHTMPRRSTGLTVLAAGTALVAVFSQYAAIALLLTDRVSRASSSLESGLTLVTGVAFVGLALLAYSVSVGLWLRRGWAWHGAFVVYASLFVASASLSVLLLNITTGLVMGLAVVAAFVFLRRPSVRCEIAGSVGQVTEPGAVVERPTVPGLAH